MLKIRLSLFGVLICLSTLSWTQPSPATQVALFPIATGSVSDTVSRTRSWKEFTDLDYEMGFFELNRKSPIDFDYNESVKKHIDYYLTKRRDLLSKVLGLSKYYFPIFEETLDKYNLPFELKYLAIIESALNPTAQSRTGAMGLWQFKYNTALMLDLVIDNYVDERQDPVKATDAACRYLDFLYNTFGDWQLAIAAYNGGPGLVRNAVIRSGGKTQFWEIMPYLSEETRNYLPGFLAMAYLMENYKTFDIVPDPPKIIWHQTDTVMIKHSISFQKVSEKLGIPAETIRFLNPSYKKNYIPLYDKSVPFVLPVSKIEEFIASESQISEPVFPTRGQVSAPVAETKLLYRHVVEKGDYLNRIALKYRCSIDDIMKWNGMDKATLHSGQELIVWVPESLYKTLPQPVSPADNRSTGNGKELWHTIQKGDNLYSISTKYPGVSVDQLKKVNNIGEKYVLLPGERLLIPQP
jgi:membrane-bound lytic murein transglycosylase D